MDGPGTAAHPHRSNRLPLPLTTATGHRQPWPRRLPRRRRQSHYVSDEGLSECQLVTSPAPPALRKHGLFFEVSLCLSRACLGKMFVFKYKWLQTIVFTHRQSLCCVREASTQAAAPASAQRGACVYHHAKQRFTTTQRACAIVVDRKASFRSIKTPLRFAGGFSFCTILARKSTHSTSGRNAALGHTPLLLGRSAVILLAPKCVAVHAVGNLRLLGILSENASLFEFSLCLSRACLGQMIIFTIKMARRTRFLSLTSRWNTAALLGLSDGATRCCRSLRAHGVCV
jgi:hypothetical protein